VESRPGANGMLGINAVKQARGDAHTLSFAHNGMLISTPLSSASNKIAPGSDYMPVVLVLKTNLILVAHPSVPFRDFNGLLNFARANPGKLDAAVVGTASNSHLALELLKSASGVNINNVPYRGEGQALPDLLAGTVKIFFMTSTAKPLMDAGKLIGIATTGAERWGMFQDLPTMQELGLPGFLVVGWFGVVAPPGTPPDVIARLNAAFNAAVRLPAVRKVLQEVGIDPLGSSTEEMNALIKTDLERWAPIMKNAGIRTE
jgi:tripartite-type tricarboxylate transporter receptor subunit TctC